MATATAYVQMYWKIIVGMVDWSRRRRRRRRGCLFSRSADLKNDKYVWSEVMASAAGSIKRWYACSIPVELEFLPVSVNVEPAVGRGPKVERMPDTRGSCLDSRCAPPMNFERNGGPNAWETREYCTARRNHNPARLRILYNGLRSRCTWNKREAIASTRVARAWRIWRKRGEGRGGEGRRGARVRRRLT